MPRNAVDAALDACLVLASRAGSSAAFVALFDRWQAKLLVHAVTLMGGARHHDLAEDVCQESWLAIRRGLHRLGDEHRFAAWAYAIVTRRAADRLRAVGKERRRLVEVADEIAAITLPADASADVQALRLALTRLPAADRALLRLFYLEELSLAETALALSIPPGTAKSRLFQARQRLRQVMQRNDQ